MFYFLIYQFSNAPSDRLIPLTARPVGLLLGQQIASYRALKSALRLAKCPQFYRACPQRLQTSVAERTANRRNFANQRILSNVLYSLKVGFSQAYYEMQK